MSRVFWFAAGAASGVYGLVKVRRTAQNFTPDGVAARLAAYRVGARLFKDEVVTAMADREQELRAQLSLGQTGTGTHLIEPGRHVRTGRATEAAATASVSPRAS